MKKLFAALITVLLVGVAVLGAGCSNAGWKEVQSITYQTMDGAMTLTSTCVGTITRAAVDTEEYDNASTEQRNVTDALSSIFSYDVCEIRTDRKAFLQEIKGAVGKQYYSVFEYVGDGVHYNKFSFDGYELRYVKVRSASDDCIEINYYSDPIEDYVTIKVKSPLYEITYFND